MGEVGKASAGEGWIISSPPTPHPFFAVNQKALLEESVAEEEVAADVGKEMREEGGEKYSWRAVPTSVMAR